MPESCFGSNEDIKHSKKAEKKEIPVLTTKELQQAQIVVSALDLATRQKQQKAFHRKCQLQCLFPERDSQVKRQSDRLKVSCYFPDIEQRHHRRSFRNNCLLRSYFPEFQAHNVTTSSLRKGSGGSLRRKDDQP